jgi:hypothetical protein
MITEQGNGCIADRNKHREKNKQHFEAHSATPGKTWNCASSGSSDMTNQNEQVNLNPNSVDEHQDPTPIPDKANQHTDSNLPRILKVVFKGGCIE